MGVAFAWTWAFAFAAVAVGGHAGHPLHLIALLGPLVAWAGVVVSIRVPGYGRDLLRRAVDVRRVAPARWVAVVMVGLGPAAGGAALAGLTGGRVTLEPGLTVVTVTFAAVFALAAGLAEEPGWRGLALDSTGRLGLIPVAVLLGVLWSSWHLPLYFLDGTYQYGLGTDTLAFWVSMALRVPLGVLLVWLVLTCRGAVVAAVLAHALGNLVGELVDTGLAGMVGELVTLAVAAVAVLARWARGGGVEVWVGQPAPRDLRH